MPACSCNNPIPWSRFVTEFSLSFSSRLRSLVLVAGEQIHDILELHIKRPQPGGDFECEVIHDNKGTPTRLVATMSREGRQVLSRASGCASSTPAIPGFVEVSPAHRTEAVRDAISKHLGATAVSIPELPRPVESLRDEIARHLGYDSKETA